MSIVVDAHVHIFPPEICLRRETHLERDVWFGELYANPRALLVTVEDLITSMDEAGIDHSIVCGFPWRDQGLCREHNEYLREAARSYPDRISWLATTVPNDPQGHLEADRCLRAGAAGIGELNADAQRFDFRQPDQLAPLADTCMSHEKPVMFHVSEPLGHAYPGKGTATPERFVQFLSAYPELKVIAAHWGGGLPFYELMPEVASVAHNVVYDSAATTYLYRFQIFRTVLDIVGTDRVLMGSDFPVLRQDRFLNRTKKANLHPEEVKAVLGLNAARLFGIQVEEMNHD